MGRGQVLSPHEDPLVSLGARLLLLLVCSRTLLWAVVPPWPNLPQGGRDGFLPTPVSVPVLSHAFSGVGAHLRLLLYTATLACWWGRLPVLVSMVPATGKFTDFLIRALWYCCRGGTASVFYHTSLSGYYPHLQCPGSGGHITVLRCTLAAVQHLPPYTPGLGIPLDLTSGTWLW